MTSPLLYAAVAALPLVVGSALGVVVRLPFRLLASMLAFASGALITALAFELFQESLDKGGLGRAAGGLALGAVVFTALSAWLDRRAEGPVSEPEGSAKLDPDAAASDRAPSPASTQGAAGLALLGAVILDGVPENVALGISLERGTGGLALLAAIVVSNLPEALVGTASMRDQGWSARRSIGTWTIGAFVLMAAVIVGAGPLAQTSDATISLPLAFAAGAVLAALADTLMPEAYERGGPVVAISTAAGFLLSYSLALV